MSGDRSYSDDEVEAIFKRAFERQVGEGDGYTHDELAAAAHEMGLDAEALQRAIAETDSSHEQEAIRAELTADKRLGWVRHLVAYLVVVGCALGLHAAGLTGVWAIWMAAIWGAGLARHGISAALGATEKQVHVEVGRRNRKARRAEKARLRRERKREAKEQRMARARAGRSAEDELERVIEEGVTALLGAAARKLRTAAIGIDSPDAAQEGDFARYVARKKGGAPAPGPGASKPRRPQVRVEATQDPVDGEESEVPVRRRGPSRGRRR